MTNTDWRATLMRAADIIEQRGLARGIQQDDQGRVCFHGALHIACGTALYSEPLNLSSAPDHPHAVVTRHMIWHLIPRYLDEVGVTLDENCGLGLWNNTDGRTCEEVVREMRLCASAPDEEVTS